MQARIRALSPSRREPFSAGSSGKTALSGSSNGDARPDSDIDLLVVMPQPRLTPQERQLALRSLRAEGELL